MTTRTITHTSTANKLNKLGSSVGVVLLLPLIWLKRIRNRRELMHLMEQPDYLMKDVGLQRDAIVREAIKRFWVA